METPQRYVGNAAEVRWERRRSVWETPQRCRGKCAVAASQNMISMMQTPDTRNFLVLPSCPLPVFVGDCEDSADSLLYLSLPSLTVNSQSLARAPTSSLPFLPQGEATNESQRNTASKTRTLTSALRPRTSRNGLLQYHAK